jgi:AcrR family transcriptional regulator
MGIQERKTREKERRRQQIMVAAKRVFVEKGFTKATMEDIAKDAELSAGTLYLYFKNKNELYASLALCVFQYLLIRLDRLTNDEKLYLNGKITDLKLALLDVYEFGPLTLKNLFHLQLSDVLKQLIPELVYEIKVLGKKALSNIASLFQEGIQQDICIERHPYSHR